jgi:hypothetical protein
VPFRSAIRANDRAAATSAALKRSLFRSSVLAPDPNRRCTSAVLPLRLVMMSDPAGRGRESQWQAGLRADRDDRVIRLGLRARTAREAGIGVAMDVPPGASSTPNVYATDLDTLRFIGAARRLLLLIDTEPSTLSYELWEDRRPALRSFVQHFQGQN